MSNSMIELKKARRWIFINALFIPIFIVVSAELHVALKIILSIVVIAGILLGALLLGYNAGKKANGSNWWEDDSSTGWRGY